MSAATSSSSADYLIVGGGTAGLVVACRLSESPGVNIIILECGPNCTQDHRVQDPNLWRGLSGSELDWKFNMKPQVSPRIIVTEVI